MYTVELLAQELDQEAFTTRRVLERVPAESFQWKPHDKSMSLGQLALHVATVPGTVAEIARQSPFQMREFYQPSATSVAELIGALDESVSKAKSILSGMNERTLQEPWRALDGEREVLTITVGGLLRSVMLNHWYHHRGQLTVYLRQVGVPLPSVYGPSADENPFAAPASVAAV